CSLHLPACRHKQRAGIRLYDSGIILDSAHLMHTVTETQNHFTLRQVIAAAVVGIVIGACVAKLLPVMGVYISFEECSAYEASRQEQDKIALALLRCSARFPE